MNFLTPRIELIDADMGFETLHEGGVLGRLRPPIVLISRRYCTFKLFNAANLSRRQAANAARIHARTAAPYLNSGMLLTRLKSGYGIWWWDMARIGAALAERFPGQRPMIRPETLAKPRGAGFRIVRLDSGFEAQHWSAGGLSASAWRQDAFDAASWRAFVGGLRTSAPEIPPSPQTLPWTVSHEAFSPLKTEIRPDQIPMLAGSAFALAAAAMACFWFGQGEAIRSEREKVSDDIAAIRLATPKSPAADASVSRQRKMLASYREIDERTNPLSAAGAAIAVAGLYDLEPQVLDASEETVSMSVPYEEGLAVVEDLSRELEVSGYFHDVRPRSDATRRNLIIEMKVRPAAPPLEPLG